MYDPRNALAQQVSAQLQEHFGKKVYETVIHATCGSPRPRASALPP